MQQQPIVAAIDVGTTKVCTILGRKTGAADFEVLAHSVVPCDGLRKGNVADVSTTASAVRRSILEASEKAGVKVDSAYVGITGAHVSYENRRDPLEWVGSSGVITSDDLTRVPDKVAAAAATGGRRVLHAIPLAYSIDGEQTIRNPLGMHGRGLEVETHVVTGGQIFVDRLIQAVESAGVRVQDLVLEPLASGEAVLTSEEKEQGVALVDIGGGTTDVVVFKRGAVRYTGVIPVGGFQFTNDICQTYGTPYADAEAAKLKYGNTEPFDGSMNGEITLGVEGRSTTINVPHRDICLLLRERAQELMHLIKVKLQEADAGELGELTLVITGGTSKLPGLEAMTKRTLTRSARIGVPNGNRRLPDELKEPAHATGVGILLWAVSRTLPAHAAVAANGKNGSSNGARPSLTARLIARIKNRLTLNLF